LGQLRQVAQRRHDINQNKNKKKTPKTKTARKEQSTSLQKILQLQQEGYVNEILRSLEEMANGAQHATVGRAKVKNCDDTTSDPLYELKVEVCFNSFAYSYYCDCLSPL
jgi:hypothetical protein